MTSLPSLIEFKNEARALAVSQGIRPSSAHEVLARSYGFKSYASFRAGISVTGVFIDKSQLFIRSLTNA